MENISITIETQKTIEEMRTFVESDILKRPEARMLLQDCSWNANTLYASGSLGEGTITLQEGAFVVDIELSVFGLAARSRIEETIREQLSRINA